MLYAGIDLGRKWFTVCIIKQNGAILKTKKLRNDLGGASALLLTAREHDEICFAVESPTSRISDFLLSHRFPVYFIKPSAIPSYRRRFRNTGNTDDFDAYVIAQALRTDCSILKPLSLLEETTQRYKSLYQDRETLIKDRTRLINRLRALLVEFFPVFLECFKEVHKPTALAFLKLYSTYEEAKALSEQEIADFLRTCHSSQNAMRIYQTLQKGQINIPEIIVETKSCMVQKIIPMIEHLNCAIKEYEKKMEELTRNDPESRIFNFKGIGPVLLCGLLGFLGRDRNRWRDYSEIQALAGTVPTTKSSGEHRAVFFRLACDKRARRLFDRIGLCSIRFSEWSKVYYKKMRSEGKTHHHAIRCIASKWCKVLFTCWKKEEPYSEEIHLANLARQQLFRQTGLT